MARKSYYNRTSTCDECKINKLSPNKAKREIKNGKWTGRWLCLVCHGLITNYGTINENKIEQIRIEYFEKKSNNISYSKIKKIEEGEHNEQIERISDNIISEIKEKVRNIPNYVHPCNKEFQGDKERLGFETGNKFIVWMQKNGILKNPTDIKYKENDEWAKKHGYDDNAHYQREHIEEWAQKVGYKNYAERKREYRYKKGENIPKEVDEDNPTYFGYISQHYVMKTFDSPKEMPFNWPGYDWICKNGQKIEHKAACLSGGNRKLEYHIEFNTIANWFILSAWKDRESLEPMYVWMIHRDDIIRGMPFWARLSFTITNIPEYLVEMEKYEVKDKLDKLKKILEDNG